MTFLEKILAVKRPRVEAAKLAFREDLPRSTRPPKLLSRALADETKIQIIAEIKRASPSKGLINGHIDAAETARQYEKGGAAAISVLTEEDFFQGSLQDLQTVRQAVELPVLRKDFVFDEFQIKEAAHYGADVILLIAAMLDDETLSELYRYADNLGLDILVEVHTLEELARAAKLGAKIIGVNNRDLHSFKVSLDVSRELIKHAPKDALLVCESGLSDTSQINEMRELGFRGFLIGETLMRSADTKSDLQKLTAKQF